MAKFQLKTWKRWATTFVLMVPSVTVTAAEGQPANGSLGTTLPVALPADFKGDDIKAVYATLRVPPKGEFETSAQHAARLSEAFALVRSRYLAFQPSAPVTLKYDVDKQRFELAMHYRNVRSASGTSDDAFISLMTERKVLGSHEARNAMDTKSTVETFEATSYGLRAPRSGKHMSKVSLKVPMTPDEAKIASESMRVMYVCRLDAGPGPVTSEGASATTATVTDPIEGVTREHYVTVGNLALWVYNAKTGAVYDRVQLVGKNEPPHSAPSKVAAAK